MHCPVSPAASSDGPNRGLRTKTWYLLTPNILAIARRIEAEAEPEKEEDSGVLAEYTHRMEKLRREMRKLGLEMRQLGQTMTNKNEGTQEWSLTTKRRGEKAKKVIKSQIKIRNCNPPLTTSFCIYCDNQFLFVVSLTFSF